MATTLYQRILSVPGDPQPNSPLFGLLPAEIRRHIFTYALTDYPDPSPDQSYSRDTCYTRPSYFSPRRSDTNLVQTCRAVYRESWFMPFTLKEQTHWLSAQDRAPPDYDVDEGNRVLRQTLEEIVSARGEENVQIDSLRVFAQMYKLEQGNLAHLLRLPALRPRSLTLTIRHADWWFWESDEPLRFEGGFLKTVWDTLPDTLREFRIELESLSRKKDQVDKIANQMIDKWYFKRGRGDGAVLFADTKGSSWEVSTWSGNSAWHGKRWIRDESEPGRIDCYVVAVTFQLESAIARRHGKVSETARRNAERNICGNRLKLHIPGQGKIGDPRPCIPVESDRA